MRNNPVPDRSDWATLVKKLRTATGMSGAELSRRLNVDRATIWRWETGKQKPENVEIIEAFAKLFAIPVETVLDAAGMRPSGAAATQATARPSVPMDPDVQALLDMLADPGTSEAVKEQIRTMMRALAELADRTPRAPRRRQAS
jgi:transcriptional regulator with XRE-family HTH domain